MGLYSVDWPPAESQPDRTQAEPEDQTHGERSRRKSSGRIAWIHSIVCKNLRNTKTHVPTRQCRVFRDVKIDRHAASVQDLLNY